MTTPAYARRITHRLPSDLERAAANQLRRIIASKASIPGNQTLEVVDDGGTSNVVLTPGMSHLLLELLRHIGAGDAVTLVPVSQMLTTQQAADILNVSRPYLISLLEKGEISYEKTGRRHRRVKADALFAYSLLVPGEITHGRIPGLFRKINEVAGGLSYQEAELVQTALDQRLVMHGLDPYFENGDDEEAEDWDEEADAPAPAAPAAAPAPGRNDPCPCGSGKKYKKCCGA